jgi:modulator of FtsH protease
MVGWENFFIAEVGASAALAGLIFVGVSINLSRILSLARLPDRALEAVGLLLAVLVVSSLQLVPGQPVTLLGIEILIIGLIIWLGVTRLDLRIRQKTDPQFRQVFLFNMLLSQLASLPYIIAGILVLAIGAGGLYALVFSMIFSFIKAILDAWVLLLEINR